MRETVFKTFLKTFLRGFLRLVDSFYTVEDKNALSELQRV